MPLWQSHPILLLRGLCSASSTESVLQRPLLLLILKNVLCLAHKSVNVSQRLHLRRKLHWQRLLKLLYIYIKIIYSYIYFTATILNPTFTNSFSEKNSMGHNCTNYSTAAMCSKNEKTKPQIQQQQIWSRENIPQKQRRHLRGESPSAANVSTHTKTTKKKPKKNQCWQHTHVPCRWFNTSSVCRFANRYNRAYLFSSFVFVCCLVSISFMVSLCFFPPLCLWKRSIPHTIYTTNTHAKAIGWKTRLVRR